MKDEEKFINLAYCLLAENMELEKAFETCLLPFLEDKDYDAFSTLCHFLLGKNIKSDLHEFRKRERVDKLPATLNRELAREYDIKVSEWQNRQKQIWLDTVQSVIRLTEAYYRKSGSMPTGMHEYMECCGNALVYSTIKNNDFEERSWRLVSGFLALSNKEHIRIQRIKSEFVPKYVSANRFVQENKINLPYYYVATWKLWVLNVSGPDTQRRKELEKLLAELPDVYRCFLYGDSLYPDNPRKEVIMRGKGKDGYEPLATMNLSVPYYDYIPTFCSAKNEEDEYKECHAKEAKNNKYFHPMTRTRMPFTWVYCDKDMPLYLNEIYKTIENEMLKRKVQQYEARLGQNVAFDETDGFNSETQSRKRLTPEQIKEYLPEIEKRLMNKSESFDDRFRYIKRQHNMKASQAGQRLKEAGFAKNNRTRRTPAKKGHTKDLVIAFAFAHDLSWEEARQLITVAGYCLSDSIERDIVIQYALEQDFSLKSCNDILEGLNEKDQSGIFAPIKGKAK